MGVPWSVSVHHSQQSRGGLLRCGKGFSTTVEQREGEKRRNIVDGGEIRNQKTAPGTLGKFQSAKPWKKRALLRFAQGERGASSYSDGFRKPRTVVSQGAGRRRFGSSWSVRSCLSTHVGLRGALQVGLRVLKTCASRTNDFVFGNDSATALGDGSER